MEMKSSEVGKNVHLYFFFVLISYTFREKKNFIDNHLKTIHVLQVTHRQIIQRLLAFSLTLEDFFSNKL